MDLYAGSGALGIEAVSRGYDHASLVDINHAACSIIKKNVALTKEENLFSVYNMRSNAALKLFAENQEKFDLVFLDPPYAKEKIAKDMLQMNKLGLLNSSATIVAETDDHTELGDISGFSLIKEHHLGKTIVRIYRKD
ncbi:Ribosomal RNA small subunit methyltransferase D [Lactobacillus helveticus]|nr:Ribosomal RNA small subunit methyltransferase D [Lactobacillus helveticus]